jgi:hypothetical protein
MPIKLSPLDVGSEDIKKALADNGISTIDDLVEAMKLVATGEKQSGGIGKITPFASWFIKFWRLD